MVLDYGAGKFTVRRFGGANSKALKAAHARYIKPFANMIHLGTLAEEKQQELFIKAFVEVAIVTWEGVYDESGKEIPFTQDNAVKLFTDLKDLFDDIYQKASSLDTFKADVGNS